MKVYLFRQHTHAGIVYPAGTTVDLPEDVAKWLLDREFARRDAIIAVDQNFRFARAQASRENRE